MRFRSLQKFALWSTTVLFGATVFLLIGQQSRTAFPSLASSAPSGMKLFGELLERNGMKIDANRSEFPTAKKGTVSVAFVTKNISSALYYLSDEENSGAESLMPSLSNLLKNSKPGSKLILVRMDPEFDSQSVSAGPATYIPVMNLGKPSYKLQGIPRDIPDYEENIGSPLGKYDNGSSADQSIAWSKKFGNTEILMLNSGLIASNRFIDKGDNAEFLVSLFRRFGGKNAHFVSYESTFGNGQPTNLFTAIGNWAVVASWQALLLFIVVCYSVSVRFGIAHPMRSRERGTTDAIDALGTTFVRTENISYASALYFDRIIHQAKTKLRIPRNAPIENLTNRVSPELAGMIESTTQRISRGEEIDVATVAAIKTEIEELNTSR